MTVRVGVLGATGAVGQRLVAVLADHDTFELAALTASDESAGREYGEATTWRRSTSLPGAVANEPVRPTDPESIPDELDLLFSALPSSVAGTIEPALCARGHVVSSNASNERMAEDVPLVIPEINPDHLSLLEGQRRHRDWEGGLVKNPNCSTIALALPLAALEPFGIETVRVATMQAVSGAGFGGVGADEIVDNVLPHIPGEAEKVETEPRKLLGSRSGDRIEAHSATISASCNRVPTLDGHLESVWVETSAELSVERALAAFRDLEGCGLASGPDQPIHVFERLDRPQPRLDRDRADGMAVSVGGVRETPSGLQFTCLVHNTVRGAAGASVLNGELLLDRGVVG